MTSLPLGVHYAGGNRSGERHLRQVLQRLCGLRDLLWRPVNADGEAVEGLSQRVDVDSARVQRSFQFARLPRQQHI